MVARHTTYQERVYTSRAGYARLDAVLRMSATLYNAALQEWRDAWRGHRVSVTMYDQTKSLTQIRSDDPEGWGALDTQVGRGVLHRLDRSRNAFFRRCKAGETPGYPRFKSGRRWHCLEIRQPRPAMVRNDRVQIKGLPVLRLKPHRPLPESESLKSLRIIRRGRRTFVDLVYEMGPVVTALGNDPEKSVSERGNPTQGGGDRGIQRNLRRIEGNPTRDGDDPSFPTGGGDPQPRRRTGTPTHDGDIPDDWRAARFLVSRGYCPARYVGIDLGVTDRITLSSGLRIRGRNPDRRKDKSRQRSMASKKKGSRRFRQVKSVIANHARRDMVRKRNENHRLSTALVRGYPVIVVEALAIRNMTRSAKGTSESPGKNVAAKAGLNRSILDQGWGQLRGQLKYKAEWAGTEYIEVDPRHTSQTCSRCGVVDATSRQGKHYRCNACGYSIDADHNAAINVLRRGLAERAVRTPVG